MGSGFGNLCIFVLDWMRGRSEVALIDEDFGRVIGYSKGGGYLLLVPERREWAWREDTELARIVWVG